jgi:hypothetical protein
LLFVGDDWAEDHHDVEVQDETGRRLAKARQPEGVSGIARLHALVGRFLREDVDAAEVKIGIETDRGPWVAALVASGHQVYAINPLQSARARQGNGVSGAKSNACDAHVLADMVRTHSHQLRTIAAKYTSRLWQLIILAELGRDGGDERLRRAREAVLVRSPAGRRHRFDVWNIDS